jgi:hypothetical protein
MRLIVIGSDEITHTGTCKIQIFGTNFFLWYNQYHSTNI